MTQHFPRLFEPIRIGTKQARNRIMRLATSTNTGQNGAPNERTVALYRRVARGGVGIVVSEGMRVHEITAAGRTHAFLLFRKEIVPALARVADAVHEEGALFMAQCNHGGRQHQGASTPAIMWGASAIACPHSGGVPHEMSKDEIAEVAAGYITSAVNARVAGCDGVEIHAAQGHLLQQFMSPFSNQRTDDYGGTLEKRLRLVREILCEVRERTGPDFIIGLRMGIHEFSPGGIDVDLSREATKLLLKLGVLDYMSLAQGNFNSIDSHLPDSHYGPTPFVHLQAQVKEVAGDLPIAASASIQTPEQAEAILTRRQADIIGLCRALVADPEWPLKAKEGRSDDIQRCISTGQCWGGEGTATRGGRLTCSINPTVGSELELPPLTIVGAAKRVVVVGGGPAGLEAARIAAERGHEVVLFESKQQLGGKLAGAERFAGYHDVAYAVQFLSRQAEKAGVSFRMGTQASLAAVHAETPDAVIVATGAAVVTPPLAGDGSIPIYAYEGDLPRGFPDGEVVVMDEDGYYWAAALTEALARQGRKVTYVTRFLEPLRELPKVSRISTLRALDELSVVFHAISFVDRAERGTLVLRRYYNQKHEIRLEGVKAVVWLGVQRVNDAIAAELRAAGFKDVRVVGDAYAPRRLVHAIGEGHRAGRAV